MERGESFLFQGTLLIDYDVETMIRTLRIPIVKLKDKELKSVRERVTCLKQELGYTPSYQEIKEALAKGFEKALEIMLGEGELSNVEKSMFVERLPCFQSNGWIYLDRSLPNEPAVVQAVDKTPGGLIRVSIKLDRETRVIKQILITGDFFTFPPRGILDLESALKFASYDDVTSIVRKFFAKNSVQIVGVTPKNIMDLIMEAADKLSYQENLSVEDVSHLYLFHGRLGVR